MPDPRIPGLPEGWRVLDFHQGKDDHRQAVVLCERDPRSDPISTKSDFVCWDVNTVEGGCFNGRYFYTYEACRQEYASRRGRIR